jgi:hypothetical protein
MNQQCSCYEDGFGKNMKCVKGATHVHTCIGMQRHDLASVPAKHTHTLIKTDADRTESVKLVCWTLSIVYFFNKITTFRKLDLLPSSGKKRKGQKPQLLGPLVEIASDLDESQNLCTRSCEYACSFFSKACIDFT